MILTSVCRFTKAETNRHGAPYDLTYAEVVPGVATPAVTFILRYRSLGKPYGLSESCIVFNSLVAVDALKALRIISGTPPPVPLEDRDPATLFIEDMVELQRRLHELRVSRVTIFDYILIMLADSLVG